MEHPDQKYIYALVNNDAALLDELYRRFSGKIRWMVLQNSGTETDAADVFQDALLSIYQKARTGNFVLTCPLEAFLYLICRNKWMNELNKRKPYRSKALTGDEQQDDVGEDSFKLAEDCMTKNARKDLLMQKLTELGEGCRKLLKLSWSGLSMEEVANTLHVTYGYARKKKSECMARLITLVKESDQFNGLKW